MLQIYSFLTKWSVLRLSVATLTSPLITISTEEIGKLHGENKNSPPRDEIKLRKNEMKVRKNEMKLPKNFSMPPWRFGNFHRGIA